MVVSTPVRSDSLAPTNICDGPTSGSSGATGFDCRSGSFGSGSSGLFGLNYRIRSVHLRSFWFLRFRLSTLAVSTPIHSDSSVLTTICGVATSGSFGFAGSDCPVGGANSVSSGTFGSDYPFVSFTSGSSNGFGLDGCF